MLFEPAVQVDYCAVNRRGSSATRFEWKSLLRVEPWQDKIRLGHEVPLHLCVIEIVRPLLEGRKDDEKTFEYISFLT